MTDYVFKISPCLNYLYLEKLGDSQTHTVSDKSEYLA